MKYGITTTACASRLQMLSCSDPEQFYTCFVSGSDTFLVIVNRMSSSSHSFVIFSSYLFRPEMDNSDGSTTGRGGSIRRDTYRHLLAFDSRIYALCSMKHSQISCTPLLVGYNWHFDLHILCTCDVPQFLISLRCHFVLFLPTAHALR